MRTTAISILVALTSGFLLGGEPAPADLRVTWTDRGEPLAGPAGSTREIPYLIRNVGGREAFAVVVRIRTALGSVGPPARVQPGPDAGKTLAQHFGLALARGIREVCIDVQLQNVSAEDPPDPNPSDNRVCRVIQVE